MIQKIATLGLFLLSLSACGTLSQKFYIFQSDNKLNSCERENFAEEKGETQWWYYDCFFEDGSVLVVLFTPYHWWKQDEIQTSPKSLVYASYMKADGEVISSERVFDAHEVSYSENSLISPYFQILQSQDEDSRNYTLKFLMDDFNGELSIQSESKAFSPLVAGRLGSLGNKVLLKRKTSGLNYRYAAVVPQGDAVCQLNLNEGNFNLKGKAYHEQGWFNNKAEEMCDGWNWYHFRSDSINMFGTRTFLYLKVAGKPIVKGLNLFNNGLVFSDTILTDELPNFMQGGTINYTTKSISFEISSLVPAGNTLIYIPSSDSIRLWGNVVQSSMIKMRYAGLEFKQEGRLIIESSRNARKESPLLPPPPQLTEVPDFDK